jgi:DNA-binding MarR family transcriptional regulator
MSTVPTAEPTLKIITDPRLPAFRLREMLGAEKKFFAFMKALSQESLTSAVVFLALYDAMPFNPKGLIVTDLVRKTGRLQPAVTMVVKYMESQGFVETEWDANKKWCRIPKRNMDYFKAYVENSERKRGVDSSRLLPSQRLRAAIAADKKFFSFMSVLAKGKYTAARVFCALFDAMPSYPKGLKVGELVARTGQTQPSVTLGILHMEKQGFVETEKDGVRKWCRIPEGHMGYLQSFIENSERKKAAKS